MNLMIRDKDRQYALSCRFTEKAQAVSALVTRIESFEKALRYCLNLCARQGSCRMKISGDEERLPGTDEQHFAAGQVKMIAAPGLDPSQYTRLLAACAGNGVACIRAGLRSHLSGVDIGFTIADLAIAETGTLVVNSPSEDLRLATMLCLYHVCLIHRSTIVEDAFAAEQYLLKYLYKTPGYTTFISGPSRTTAIERVPTLGVHGPLELHILLLED